MSTVCAVVLTYNRKDLLDKCLVSLITQDYQISKIVVVDNCSNDGTDEVLDKYRNKICCVKLDKNYGASYGFNVSLKEGYKSGCDYIWVMDDDTIPEYDALRELIHATEEIKIADKLGFVCSDVRWTDGNACKMNIPRVNEEWNEYVNKKLIRVESCSFVSALFPRNVVKAVGFPISDFYIWATDLEYTLRITKNYGYVGYYAIDSRVIHAMKSNNRTDIVLDSSERISRYQYSYRNQMFIAKKDGFLPAFKSYVYGIRTIIRVLRVCKKDKMKKSWAVFKGINNGIIFNPRIEYIQE